MTALKSQAVSMIYAIPNEQMGHVIEILRGLNKIIADTAVASAPSSTKLNRLKTWGEFKKYKGIIPRDICEQSELARARDEKYADII